MENLYSCSYPHWSLIGRYWPIQVTLGTFENPVGGLGWFVRRLLGVQHGIWKLPFSGRVKILGVLRGNTWFWGGVLLGNTLLPSAEITFILLLIGIHDLTVLYYCIINANSCVHLTVGLRKNNLFGAQDISNRTWWLYIDRGRYPYCDCKRVYIACMYAFHPFIPLSIWQVLSVFATCLNCDAPQTCATRRGTGPGSRFA